MAHGYLYTFPAIRGVQAGSEYYVAMCPLKLIPRMFLFDEEEVPVELRAQRTLNKARIPDIAKYIVENQNNYAFSALTASIDGDIEFKPSEIDSNEDIGYLHVSMSSRIVINDGQHRRAAIELALQEEPSLGDETIAIVFYKDQELKKCQQLFADLNKHAVRPTRSLGILYDHRDPLASLARELTEKVPLFKGLTEKEKTTISNRSIKLFTLNAIYQATRALLKKKKNASLSKKEQQLSVQFWTELGEIIPEWQLVIKREVSSAELRREYVHSHSVALHAIGIACAALFEKHPNDWRLKVRKLGDLDWSRSNPMWEGRAMSGGQMSKARQNLLLTTNLLKTTLGLSLTAKEKELETKHGAVNGSHATEIPSLDHTTSN